MNPPLHIVCPHCAVTNKIPGQRIGENPACGRCHRPLFTAHPVELTADTFTRHVARSEIPVLVDFWAPWCAPCRGMTPAYEQAASELEPQVRVARLNTEQAQTIATQYVIRSIPTLLLFHGGREVARQVGAMGATDILCWTRTHLRSE